MWGKWGWINGIVWGAVELDQQKVWGQWSWISGTIGGGGGGPVELDHRNSVGAVKLDQRIVWGQWSWINDQQNSVQGSGVGSTNRMGWQWSSTREKCGCSEVDQ